MKINKNDNHNDDLDEKHNDNDVNPDENGMIENDVNDDVPVVRRSTRSWQPSDQCLRSMANVNVENENVFLLASHVDVPKSFGKNLKKNAYKNEWRAAMDVEFNALVDNVTFVEVKRMAGMHVIGCMWVYALKANPDGTVSRFKARLVALGNQQVYGIDYKETHANVARLATFRLLLVLCLYHGLTIYHIDIGNAYLNAKLEEEIYMLHPPGYHGTQGTVLRLEKALYGLKQAGREWAGLLKHTLLKLDFQHTASDPCIYNCYA